MFALKEYSPAVLAAFADPHADPYDVLRAAIDGGETDTEDLTDLVFFKAHPERVTGLDVDFISRRERNSEALSAEWKAYRTTIVEPALIARRTPTSPPAGDPIWEVDPVLAWAAKKMGGRKLLAWVKEAPTGAIEVAEFRPTRAQRRTYVSIVAWKSRDPRTNCIFSKARVQFIYLLRDDHDFWLDHSPSERQAIIKQAAQEASNRAYRSHVLDDGLCPERARLRELDIQKSLLLTMASGLAQLIPTPGIKGTTTSMGDWVKSTGELLSAAVSLLGD